MTGDSGMGASMRGGAGLNPEVDIFKYVSFASAATTQPQAHLDPNTQPQKRPRPEQQFLPRGSRNPRRGGGRPPQGAGQKQLSQDTVRTMTKIIIRQEDQLAELRGDKGFFIFLREDPEMSVIPGLVQISKDWHSRLEAGDLALQSPLRTLLLACLIKRLRELMVLMTSTSEAIAKLQAAEWLDQAGEWTYFRWNPQEKKLKRHAKKGTISQPALLEKVDFLLANLRGDIVQKFSSKQKLYEMEEESPTTATFFMSISLRGALSHQVHDCFVQLIGVAALQLIGASLKREIPKRSPLVQQLAEAVFH